MRCAEEFLWWLCNNNRDIPKDKPRRGTILPTIPIAAQSKACSVTWVCRSAFTNKLDDALGIINDLKNRIFRLNGNNKEEALRQVTCTLSDSDGNISGTAHLMLNHKKFSNHLHLPLLDHLHQLVENYHLQQQLNKPLEVQCMK